MSNMKLKQDFKLLRAHCIELMRNYNTYTDLFNEDNRTILSDVAATFFTDIAEIMHRDWILQACKLMDPAITKVRGVEKENITLFLIDKQLDDCGLLNQSIKDISKNIKDYGAKIKPARHKRLAHYDREHQINNITLGETTESELHDFLNNMQSYCDEVGNIAGLGPLDFSSSSCKGDALDLLKYLRDCKIKMPNQKINLDGQKNEDESDIFTAKGKLSW